MTLNVFVVELPELSVAVQVTSVVRMKKFEPEVGRRRQSGSGSRSSVAVAVCVAVGPGAGRLDREVARHGQIGRRLSSTVTLELALPVFRARRSSAVDLGRPDREGRARGGLQMTGSVRSTASVAETL